MNPISNTAYYCCGVRMLDAEHPRSLCHDHYAKRFMDAHGMQIFEPFRSQVMPNISSTVRCHIIDQSIRQELAKQPDSLIITIGAGFDSRPYRIKGGHWIEIDEPQIISDKNEKLPIAECKNNLTRVSINFANEKLIEKLQGQPSNQSIIIVIEGVFMYLENDAIKSTIQQLRTLYPNHTLLCDLMSKKMFDQFGRNIHEKLVEAGARFTTRPDDPTTIFTEHGYIQAAHTPMFKLAYEMGILWDRGRIPKPIARLLYHTIMRNIQGYAVHRLELGST
ncbi:MAG TPA: class I SAM-dependent methyltransferase [Methylophilaceae bacterium]|jgi:methyltransferase (TIGR00027 family)